MPCCLALDEPAGLTYEQAAAVDDAVASSGAADDKRGGARAFLPAANQVGDKRGGARAFVAPADKRGWPRFYTSESDEKGKQIAFCNSEFFTNCPSHNQLFPSFQPVPVLFNNLRSCSHWRLT